MKYFVAFQSFGKIIPFDDQEFDSESEALAHAVNVASNFIEGNNPRKVSGVSVHPGNYGMR